MAASRGIPASRTVTAFFFAECQDSPNNIGIYVSHMQIRRRQSRLRLGVFQQEPERVAIADKGIWAGLHLGQQPLGEEPLHVDRQGIGGDHDVPSRTRRSARAAASCISSGTASM